MGCTSSTDGEKGRKGSNEEPELMGKAKFLSCPAMCEVVDATQTKWLLLVFAPLTHHGLIFAARNSKDGSLLVKDIVDKQVAREKEEQKVQLSYNLFFKAISTEVAKATRSGAKVEWLADGSMSVECKIAISGSASSNKKPDTYTAVLKPVASSEENLFKYVAEPLATHYCKKRTDGWNLDRPDPHREKIYGEQEASAIIRTASIRSSQKVLDKELPNIVPLRNDHAAARAERDAAVAKVNVMKQMLLCASSDPPLALVPPEDVFAAIPYDLMGQNTIAASQEAHCAYPTPSSVQAALNEHRSGVPDEVPVAHLDDWDEFVVPSHAPVFHVGMAVFRSLELVGTEPGQVSEQKLREFLNRMDILHRSTNAFHNAKHGAQRLHAMYYLVKLAKDGGFNPDPQVLLSGMLAAVVHDADHAGLANYHGALSSHSSYIPTLYNYDSHVERHSLAVGICELEFREIFCDTDIVASIVLWTDMGKHQSFSTQMSKTVQGVADLSRRPQDQAVALGGLLKAADMCHLYKAKADSDAAFEDLAAECRAGDSANDISTESRSPHVFVSFIGKPYLKMVASVFPTLSFTIENCQRNYPV